MSPEHKTPCSFEEIFQQEQEFIKEVRKITGRTEQPGYVGIALSGGGIRSAAFQLGVLQVLATYGVLNIVDYCSCVSGGGYTAGWFIKWFIDKEARARKENPFDALKITPGKPESERILWVRKHSNYLTPHVGLLRHDSIFLATTYLQSLIFNSLVLFIFLSALLLLVPGSALGMLMTLGRYPDWLEIGGGGLALGALFLVLLRMVYTGGHETPEKPEIEKLKPSLFPLIYLIQAAILTAILFLVHHSPFQVLMECLIVLLALAWLFCKSESGKFGLPTGDHSYRAIACSLVVVPFIYFLNRTRLCPHWPEIIYSAWLWSAPVDLLFETRNISQRWRRWIRATTATIGAFAITAFMFYRSDRKQIQENGLPRYNDISHFIEHGIKGKIIISGSALLLVIVVCVLAFPPMRRKLRKFLRWTDHRSIWKLLKFGVAAIMTAAASIFTLLRYQAVLRWIDKNSSIWKNATPLHVLTILTPLCIVVGALQFSFTVAMLGNLVSPAKRERIWADCTTIYRCVLAWLALAVGAIYAPALASAAPCWIQVCLLSLWACSLIIGFWHFKFDPAKGALPVIAKLLIRVSTYIFVLGLLVLVSMSNNTMIKIENIDKLLAFKGKLVVYFNQFAHSFTNPATWVYAGAILLLSGLLMAALDVNLSSMHYFFQGRVARAFLLEHLPGSEWTLRPSTTADRKLGTPSGLVEYRPKNGYYGPLPIFNAALNLGVTNVLDWQDRKAANFIFTPAFSGFDNKLVTGEFMLEDSAEQKGKDYLSEYAYAATDNYKYGDESGVRLASAMAISGSAIGSAMGPLTSVKTRILHTFLNLRLGWWFPNPRVSDSWSVGKLPQWWIVFKEFMGWADAKGAYVHLSDGGHFENLGVYELVKRRCKVIIISDASEDREATFKCLSIAIQKCRVDFNCIIRLNVDPVSPQISGLCKQNFAIGTIDYGQNTPGGIVVYLRPTITEHQSTDIISAHRTDGYFPHNPTINQWFSESLFEAYRELGQSVAEAWIRQLHFPPDSPMTDVDFISRCEAMAHSTQRGVSSVA